MSNCNSYHHGDLRNALIIAAVKLIEESGSSDFSMSEAAKLAGVSAAAPYRHFADRKALLSAVAELYFIGLAEAVQSTRDAYPSGSRESVLALGHCYVRYLSERPAFYNLIWNQGGEASQGRRDVEQRPGFLSFVGAVGDWCRQRELNDCDPLELAVKLWSMAHGLSVLKMNGQLDSYIPDADAQALLSSSAGAFLDGVEATR